MAKGGNKRAGGRRKTKRPNPQAIAAAKHSHTDAGPDRIVCLLCGETYKAITFTHLVRVHDFERDHPVQDYKAMFGLEVACSEEVREASRARRIEKLKRDGAYRTDAEILAALRRRQRAGRSIAASKVPQALALLAVRRFGSYDEALRRAGFDPEENRIHLRRDGDRVLDEIRALALPGVILSDKQARARHHALYRAAFRRHGSWGAALEAAGLDPDEHVEPTRWNLAEADAWIRRRIARGASILSRDAPSGLLVCVRREAGKTWADYVESIGLEYPGISKRLDWSDTAVVAAIRRRRRARKRLNLEAVRQDEGQALVHQARNRFGSWDAALEAAGIDPLTVRLKRNWTRKDVIEAIHHRQRAGRSLTRKGVFEEYPRLVNAAARLFPSSWARALAAAGVDPAQARAGGGTPQRERRPRHK